MIIAVRRQVPRFRQSGADLSQTEETEIALVCRYGTAATGLYLVAKGAQGQARLEQERGTRPPPREYYMRQSAHNQQYGGQRQRPHYQ